MWTALLNAAKNGYTEICKVLLDAGANIEDSDVASWTPLCWAVYKKREDIVRLFIEKGASVNVIDEHTMTPLLWASGRGYTNIVDQLLRAGARVAVRDGFGNDALIWGSYVKSLPIVQLLLKAGSCADTVGMRGLTALILATQANSFEMVKAILEKPCAVNAVDHKGHPALYYAVSNGNAEIVKALLEAGAYVNPSEQIRESVLLKAVKSGFIDIVRLLLDHHVDIDCQDSEGRTALHLAIDKGFLEIVQLLLENEPNLELKNADGDTPLLKSARNRNLAFVQLLKQAGANVGAVDKNGDTSVHIALRCRSRRMVQILLAPPFDSRILYQPNKNKETAYSIDRAVGKPILPQIFGPLDSASKTEAMMGYELYSSALADVLCAPNLSLPLFVGLYAKWGSGKSFLLRKVRGALTTLSRSWLSPSPLIWSWSTAFLLNFISIVFGLFLFTFLPWKVALWPMLIIFAAFFLTYLYVMKWKSSLARRINMFISRKYAFIRLTFQTMFFDPPAMNEREIFNYRRLSNFECEHALTNIIDTFYAGGQRKPKPRRLCGIPLMLLMALVVICFFAAVYLFLLYYQKRFSGPFLLSLLILATVGLLSLYPTSFVVIQSTVFRPRRAMKRLLSKIEKLSFEAFMEKLRAEVQILQETVDRLDCYTRSQTRLVIFVDGLDSCEGSRIVQTLDAIQVLFGRSQASRFIVLISVDPHVVIAAVRNNLQSAFLQSEVSSYDYLKLIIHMPLYLRNSEFVKLHQQLAQKQRRNAPVDTAGLKMLMRQETVAGSYWSLADSCRGSIRSPKPSAMPSQTFMGPEIVRDDYFGDLNPRSLRRIVNALSLTGRLMRAFEIDFSWVTLGHWTSLIEQWPYRMSWTIEYAERCGAADHVTLREMYNMIKDRIPNEHDYLIEMDRNPKGLDSYFQSELDPVLCVHHMRTFIPFTSNLDPYVRKLIRDKLETFDLTLNCPMHPMWRKVRLSTLSVMELCQLLKALPLSNIEAVEKYCRICHTSNISGLTLSVCELDKLKSEFRMSFGDWEIFCLMVNYLRKREKQMDFSVENVEENVALTQLIMKSSSTSTTSTLKRRKQNEDEANMQHNWLQNRLGHLDKVDYEEEAADKASSLITNSRRSSVTFEFDELQSPESGKKLSPYNTMPQIIFLLTRPPSEAEKGQPSPVSGEMSRPLLSSSDSEEEDNNQLTVRPKETIFRPSILNSQNSLIRASSEPGVNVE
ncbi:putative P-loop domain protein, KAP family [Trichinella nativa]|uniref:Putative P-loop domain protein, KAP family n=1 Tax=Trichinella nativa TaxID=6335 RepID=A0A1Y3ELF0_9BILA|nr:putative P-loop domain protein, KAP family [Trichinella nativa]